MTAVKRKGKPGRKSGTPEATRTEETVRANTGNEPARRVLVAEDSPVTQDLLKLLLEQRGHSVDLASNGEEAFAALDKQSYDVVLLDFHLPKMDGLEVASRYRAARPDGGGPRFVAITADIKGLLGHADNCENFDEVIPKPLDLEEVVKVIERESEQGPPAAKTPGTAPREVAVSPSAVESKHAFLRWPDDINSGRLSARGLQATLADGSFDAILINEPASVRDLSALWTTKTLHLLPIIDMTGSLAKQADLDGTKVSTAETGAMDKLIASFRERREMLHRDLVYTDDIGEKLVGRMFVSGGSLTPSYSTATHEFVCYNVALDFRSIDKEIKELAAHGLVSGDFFDRFHLCDRCGSSHFNVREECVECGSAHLEEEAYLHHFQCAYQGPETDFRQGDDLICPKCRQELSHFSIDYDKPGLMLQCRSCGHATSEPDVGFVCMECEAHYDGDTVHTRDVYAYELTAHGHDFAKAGRVLLDGNNAALRFAELPLELIIAMNTELKKYEADKTPFALLSLSYANQRQIEQSEGRSAFARSRELLLENLRNTLRKGDCVVKGQRGDFVLLKATPPEEVRASMEELCSEATATMRVDVGLSADVFGPEDFS